MTAPHSGLPERRLAVALALHGVSKSYAGRRVLDGIDLEIPPGAIVALLGPNGAGKSTLLRIAANLTQPDTGRVEIQGAPARHDAHAARRHVGYVGQEPSLYDDLTPAEHVRFWGRLRQAPAAPDAVLGAAGLAAAAHKPAGTLSRGQRQRLALALATLGSPALWVLDEPFTALDANGQADLEAALRAHRQQGAVLVALHDEAQARRIADRVVRLEHHHVTQVPA